MKSNCLIKTHHLAKSIRGWFFKGQKQAIRGRNGDKWKPFLYQRSDNVSVSCGCYVGFIGEANRGALLNSFKRGILSG